MKKILTLAAVVAAMMFVSGKALAVEAYPIIPVNLSFTLQFSQEKYSTNSAGTTQTSSSVQTVSLNNKSIIYLINLFDGANIPADAYLVWNVEEDEIYVTNSSGFYYNPDIDLEPGYYNITGQASETTTTGAGSEKDLAGYYFYMEFGGENYIELYSGLGSLSWTYGTASSGSQPVTLSTSIGFQGAYRCYFEDDDAVVTSGKITGSGKGTDPASEFPYYINY
jgi:hypothetical protein